MRSLDLIPSISFWGERIMSVSSNQLQYLYANISEREISRQSGIARTTLQYWKAHEYSVPSYAFADIRNTYERTVYQQFRELGATVESASSWKWKSPQTVEQRLSDIDRISSFLARDRTQKASKREGAAFSEIFQEQYFNETKRKIRK